VSAIKTDRFPIEFFRPKAQVGDPVRVLNIARNPVRWEVGTVREVALVSKARGRFAPAYTVRVVPEKGRGKWKEPPYDLKVGEDQIEPIF
jgi:hypothetical protein